MTEILYSGGWVGLMLGFALLLYWRVPSVRQTRPLAQLCLFIALTGLGLWIMQGSNLVTGKLLETGEHVRTFIAAWLVFSTVALAAGLYQLREELRLGGRIAAGGVLLACAVAAVYLNYKNIDPFVRFEARAQFWHEEQAYAPVFVWLQEHEPSPVVVWSDPADYLTTNLPLFTRHYTLFSTFGMWHLVSQAELDERYLVSQYFNRPRAETLQQNLEAFMGRQYLHWPPTAARERMLCLLLRRGDASTCGAPKTVLDFVGRDRFHALEHRFDTDIAPSITDYLQKYHVSYVLKSRSSSWRPEELGATLVYATDAYELYHLAP